MSDAHIFRLFKLFLWGLGRLPVGVADFLADLLGLLWFKIDKRHQRVALENITHAFGNDMTPFQIEAMAKRVFKNIASILFEVAWAQKFDKETFLSFFTIKGLDHVKKAHAKGRGVIVVTCHMGNFEMLIPAIDETGFKGYAIYRAMDFKPLERLIKHIRQRFGVTMIPIIGASKKIDKVLGQGGVVGTLLDQNVDWYKGAFVDYFGRPACTKKGLAILALRTKAPVIPMYTVRKNRKYLIEFLEEVPLKEPHDPIKNLEINTANYNNAIESMVRRQPDQYFWVHNRWKTKNFCPWPKSQ
ncbi:MAG: lysophospholipid acyltransferase family protein [Desulfobacter sp.]|nr:lysophospholipid acyltransferase family protein [Desulfobacter sp.]WDP85518.1 MAG: lysophospholipid acyltransferase family protein [Desulfobacter sp.]